MVGVRYWILLCSVLINLSTYSTFFAEGYADLNIISLSDRRQIELGQETIFESRSGRLFQATLADLSDISTGQKSNTEPISITKASFLTRVRNERRRKKNKQSSKKDEESSSSDSAPNSSSNSETSQNATNQRADAWLLTKVSSGKQTSSDSDGKLTKFIKYFFRSQSTL